MIRLGSPSQRPLPRAAEAPFLPAVVDLGHQGVSSRHVRLCAEPELTVEDLGSQEGTFLEGRRLLPHRPERIAAGQALRLGSITVLLVRQPRAEPAVPATTWAPVI